MAELNCELPTRTPLTTDPNYPWSRAARAARLARLKDRLAAALSAWGWWLGRNGTDRPARQRSACTAKIGLQGKDRPVRQRLARRAKIGSDMDARPTSLDLFCGCGGFTLGMEQAGFRTLGAVDFDPHAVKVFQENFPHVEYALQADLTQLTPQDFQNQTGITLGSIDVIIPPRSISVS